jgi:hypothetical protein
LELIGVAPNKEDYTSNLPQEIVIAANFVQTLLSKDEEFSKSYNYLSDSLKQRVSLDALQQLGIYYRNLRGYWGARVALSSQQPEGTLVLIPLYFKDENHQAKIWTNEREVVGLDFNQLQSEETWKAEFPQLQRYIIDVPNVVIRKDGTKMEICTPLEEARAL